MRVKVKHRHSGWFDLTGWRRAPATRAGRRLRLDATWPWADKLHAAIERARTRLRLLTPAIHPGLWTPWLGPLSMARGHL
jgi:hypothetical protein